MSRPTTVLVTCGGSMPAVGIVRALKEQSEAPVRVVAVDANPLSAGFHLADAHATVPGASDPAYFDAVLAVAKREGATVLFPVIDEELLFFAENRSRFTAEGVTVVTNAAETVRNARDKLLTVEFCRKHGIGVPDTWTPEEAARKADALPYPVVVKPRSGRGTLGVNKAKDAAELRFFLARTPNAMVQRWVEGQEFTIDVLTDFDGRFLAAVPKARLETKAGMQTKGRTVNDPRLIRWAETVTQKFGLAPRANVQVIDDGRDLHLIEVNPKFPTSLPFTVAAGVNAPLLLVKLANGERVEPMVGKFRDGLVMLRYWQEIFV